MKKIVAFLLLVVFGWLGNTGCSCHSGNSGNTEKNTFVDQSLAYKSYVNSWENFRLNFPYHIQTIGVFDFETDNSRIIIISEPPPHFSQIEAELLFSSSQVKSELMVHNIGYDGWVKDFVLILSGGSKEERQTELETLYQYVYISDYKPHFLDLSSYKIQQDRGNLNYSVSAAELNEWFLRGKETFFKNDEEAHVLEDLLNSDKRGVYYSKNPGFVTWIIPKGNIDPFIGDARKFALDADLIVGAISNHSHVAIIGRERVTDEYALPPLRAETILQLAAADKQQISQSYERTRLFAGKLPGGKDWAPIYLSNDLINTEYGSLLNITDQILKGWSEHGAIAYSNFMYAKPDNYPFKQPISKELETNVITFNWNTKGAAYAVKYNNMDVVALNRTGSLPVTYIPEGIAQSDIPFKKIRAAEDSFYNFFSAVNDPNLVRVVQYASIYQIFSAFGVTSYQHTNSTYFSSTDVLIRYTDQLLKGILEYTNLPDNVYDSLLTCLKQSKSPSLYRDLSFLQGFEYAVYKLKPELTSIMEQFGKAGLDVLSYTLTHPRELSQLEFDPRKLKRTDVIDIINWAEKHHTNFDDINNGIAWIGISRDEIMKNYVDSYSGTYANWIKTPSVVISWNADSVQWTGGHNIRSRMLDLEVDQSLTSGQIKIVDKNGIKKVFVAESDVNHISPAMIREVETRGLTGIQQVEGKMLGGSVREREIVFPSLRKERGFEQPAVSTTTFSGNTFRFSTNGKPYSEFTINGKKYISEIHTPHVLFPEAELNGVEGIIMQMKNRKLDENECKVISFVSDDKTNRTLENYCHDNFIKSPVSSIDGLRKQFRKNKSATFHLMGHIEQGAIHNERAGIHILLTDIEKLAKEEHVNYLIIGCETAFERGAGGAGFINKINSVQAANALGMAIESSRDYYTFTHTLANSSDLKMIVYEVPVKEFDSVLAEKMQLGEHIIAIASGIAAGTLIIACSSGTTDRDKQNDSLIHL